MVKLRHFLLLLARNPQAGLMTPHYICNIIKIDNGIINAGFYCIKYVVFAVSGSAQSVIYNFIALHSSACYTRSDVISF